MAEMIKLTIDGIPVEVERGKTILEAAQSVGIRIPTLCHDKRLTPFGACRLCVVEQKGGSELLPSCFTPVREGMEIITQSPKIIESRRVQLQLILLNHPMICPRCEREGECDLQDLVYKYGIKDTIYPWEPIAFPLYDLSPLLKRDPNKCILCGRCVRICDEVQGVGELSFTHRGMKTTIDTDFHRPLQCEFCGQCLDTCPVGAITSDCFDYTTKVWQLTETTSPCPYCGCGCLLSFGSKEGEVKRVFSNPERGPNDGNLCVKGRFGWDFVDHPERLKNPLLRVNGDLKEVSWEEALRFIVHSLEEIKEKYSPESIGALASSRLTNEEYYLFKKLFKEVIGANQIDHDEGRTYRVLTEGLAKTLGFASSTNSIQEIRGAHCVLIIGVDPAQSHPIIKNEIHLAIRRNRAQLIVVGSYDIGLSQATQLSPLSPPAILLLEKPGRELSLLHGMIETILREGLENKAFIEERAEGIEVLREKMATLDSDFSEEKRREIERAARIYAQTKRAMILIGSGCWSHLDPEETALASSNLAILTGHLGKESSGILLLLEKCNSQGAIDMEVFSNEETTPLFQKAAEGKLKALYLVGENPLSPSDSERLRKALANLHLLVVQDLFLTETAKMAHVVLPACPFVEKSGTFTNLERRVQRLHPLRSPKDQSKSDFEIFLELLRLMEASIPGETPEAIFEEIRRKVPNYQGIEDGEQWPKGANYLYLDGFPMGKAKLIPISIKRPPPNPEGYPYYLIQRPSLFQSSQLSLRSDNLGMVLEKPSLEMNSGDAETLGIRDGDTVQVSTQEGRSLKMKMKISSRPTSGVAITLYPCSLIKKEGGSWIKIESLRPAFQQAGKEKSR